MSVSADSIRGTLRAVAEQSVRDVQDRATGASEEAPQPQPELHEPRLPDPRVRDLSWRDRWAIVQRAGKEALADDIFDAAAAVSYYCFLALPALLFLTLGLFSLLAGPSTVDTVMNKLGEVAPEEAITLLRGSLDRIVENNTAGVTMLAIGVLLGVWTVSGAMTALMRALNRAYEREETRGMVRQRLTAAAMFACAAVAFVLVFGLLILGPHLADWIGSAVGLEGVVTWVWWAAQWPVLLAGLFGAFAAILYLGPNVDHPRWQFLTPGSALAVLVWLIASGGFAAYVSMFGSYNKTWGTLAAVVIVLTWLWLGGLALLLGAEVNAEAERSRELRQGAPATHELQAPPKN